MDAQGRPKQERKPKLSKPVVNRVENVSCAPNALIPIRPAPSSAMEPSRVNLNLPFMDVAPFNPNDPYVRDTIAQGQSSGMPNHILYPHLFKPQIRQPLNLFNHYKTLPQLPSSKVQSTIARPSNSGMNKNLYTMRSVAAINDSPHTSLPSQCGPMQRLQAIPTSSGRLQQVPRQSVPKPQSNMNMKQVQNMQALEVMPRPANYQPNLKACPKVNMSKGPSPLLALKNSPTDSGNVSISLRGLNYHNRNTLVHGLRALFHFYIPKVKTRDLHLLIVVNRLKGLCVGLEQNVFPEFVSRFIPRMLEMKNLPFEFEIKDAPRNTPLQDSNAVHIPKNEVHQNSVRMALAFKDMVVNPPQELYNISIEFSVGHINVKIAASGSSEANVDTTETCSIKREDNSSQNDLLKKSQKTMETQTVNMQSFPVLSQNLTQFAKQHLATMAKLSYRQKRFETLQNDYFVEGSKLQKSIVDAVNKVCTRVSTMKDMSQKVPLFVEHSSQKRKTSSKVARVSREAQTDEITLENLPQFPSQHESGKLSIVDAISAIIKLAVKTLVEMEKYIFILVQERDRLMEENFELRKDIRKKDVTLKHMTQALRDVKYSSRSTSSSSDRRSDRNKSSMSTRKIEEEKRLKRKRDETPRRDDTCKKDDKSSQKDNKSSEKDSRNPRKNEKSKKSSTDDDLSSSGSTQLTDNNSKRDALDDNKLKKHKTCSSSENSDSIKSEKITIKKEKDEGSLDKIDDALNQIKQPIYLLASGTQAITTNHLEIAEASAESVQPETTQTQDGCKPNLEEEIESLTPPSLRPLIIPDHTFPAVETQRFITAVDLILQESTLKIKLVIHEYMAVELLQFKEETDVAVSCEASLAEFNCDEAGTVLEPAEFIDRCREITNSININFKEEPEEEEGFRGFIQNPEQYLDGIEIDALKLQLVEPPTIHQEILPMVPNSEFKVEHFEHQQQLQQPAMDIEISNLIKPVNYDLY